MMVYLKNPRIALIGSGESEERRKPHGHTTSGHGTGPVGKKNWGGMTILPASSIYSTISAFFKVIFSALDRASVSCDLFIPLFSLVVCAEALMGASELNSSHVVSRPGI
jgi:hypothetical protein